MRWGRGKYFMGSSWYYVLASALYRAVEPPYVLGGILLFYGYLRALFTGHRRYDNPKYRRYIRKFEGAQLFRGKSRALALENERIYREYGDANHANIRKNA